MDDRTFDRWAMDMAKHPTRRAALRLVAGGLLGGLLTWRRVAPVYAVRPDRDGDGLFDDDEVNVYGTNPDVADTDGDTLDDGYEIYIGNDPLVRDFGGAGTDRDGDGLYDIDETQIYGTNPDLADTDGDGIDDGQEVYNGTDPLARCNPGLTNCGGICVDLANDRNHCGACGAACAEFVNCWESNCGGIPDVPAPLNCPPGLTDCGGVCVDVRTDPNNCGLCGWECPGNDICIGGFCTLAQCPGGTTRCGPIGLCADLSFDNGNCGACDRACPAGLTCCFGQCVDLMTNDDFCGSCITACQAGSHCVAGQYCD